jgi:hypothetical protein
MGIHWWGDARNGGNQNNEEILWQARGREFVRVTNLRKARNNPAFWFELVLEPWYMAREGERNDELAHLPLLDRCDVSPLTTPTLGTKNCACRKEMVCALA